MKIVHVSAECYPAAKAGGLGDVIGALPKYQNKGTHQAVVCMPYYHTPWLVSSKKEVIETSCCFMGDRELTYQVYEIKENLGFSLYAFDIPGYTDRKGIYLDPESNHGYWDEFERFLSFQIAVCTTINGWAERPDIVHCHDHHTALIPFMMQQCQLFAKLSDLPTVITVHNAEYHGNHELSKRFLLPHFDEHQVGLLEWNGELNSLACGLKCAWKITTVSPSYMNELQEFSNGLEFLFSMESGKSLGILNGIDPSVWDPTNDQYLDTPYGYSSKKDILNVEQGKRHYKHILCGEYELDPSRPTFAFIGRLVHQKGADLLASVIRGFALEHAQVNFILLGTGEAQLQHEFATMDRELVGFFDAKLSYNEALAHRMYAGADFMIMPSRVEPCGLNQFYSMRYGTIPIVRAVGGLKDSVPDIDQVNGLGIQFDHFSYYDLYHAIQRAIELYADEKRFRKLRELIMQENNSWSRAATNYQQVYEELNSYR
ncbi:MAG: glycogen/starch synthase [Bacteroidota bacterium]